MRTRFRATNDSGSVVIAITVVLVTTGLITVLLFTVLNGLRVSRRSGDSANALQVADAGVNDALSVVPTAPGNTVTRSATVGTGTYEYTATRDTYTVGSGVQLPIWHIDATGVDASGVKRRVRADGVAEGLFSQAIFVVDTGGFGTGLSVDSYVSGTTPDNRCTGKGSVGSNNPGNLQFGPPNNGNPNNQAHNNCKDSSLVTNPWEWPADACIAYGPANLSQPYPPYTGTAGHCPPATATPGTYPGTWKEGRYYRPGTVRRPSTPPATDLNTDFTCRGATSQGNNSVAASPLTAGQVIIVRNLNLYNGCSVTGANPATADSESPGDVAAGAAKVFVTGDVTIGGNGSNDVINRPPSTPGNSTGVCGATGALVPPASDYCPGWSKTLQVYIIGSGTVSYVNSGMKLWGIVHNASGTTNFSAPTMEVWGALVSGTVSGTGQGAPQWSWHYDESLSSILSGRFFLANWREEAITP